MKNKETNTQQQPDSGIHNTSTHCPCEYKVLSINVPEKSVTKTF